MTKKRLDKKIPVLEPNFREILVCKPKNARPYLEVFVYEPENVFLENLGTLFGVLEINDDSPDSSYVVNYLISVIKKEFFSNVKRGTIESFESALHKANLALSKLAEHDHISWIGKINAICAVVEKNNIHLSSTGSACALLLRSKALVNISEGGEAEDPNPLKTFQEVVSGRLEDGDKIIITTGEIFEIFSLEEIKRSAIKFSEEEFFRFLNTALVNEMERAAVLISDIMEKKEVEPEVEKKSRKINAFSQSAFIPNGRKRENVEEKSILAEELKRELEKTREGYTDEKTGHIYIKDDGLPGEKPTPIKDYSRGIMERVRSAKEMLPKLTISPNQKPKHHEAPEKLEEEKIVFNPAPGQEYFAAPIARESLSSRILPKIKAASGSTLSFLSHIARKTGPVLVAIAFYTKSFAINRIYIPLKGLSIITFSFLRAQSKNLFKKKGPANEPVIRTNDYSERPEALVSSRQEKRDWFNALSGNSAPQTVLRETAPQNFYPQDTRTKNYFPSMEKISGLFSRFSKKEKIFAGMIVAVLVIVPYFIAKALQKSEKQPAPAAIEVKSSSQPLENDKNVVRIEKMENISDGDFMHLADANGKIFAVGENTVTSIEDGKKYDIATEFQDPDLVFSMDDLNLVFLYKDGKIVSIHANSRKYQNNNISVPENSDIVSGAAYLTYGYLLDQKNNQIYRYPRADGGFGEKTDWIKDKTDLTGAKDMAINENVYVTDGKNILKFNRGKKQDFSIEETATPLAIDHIYTKPDSQNLYVLDKSNSRIIKLDTEGKILAQYWNPEVSTASDFTVSEENHKVYIADENGIESFSMN